ncbi:MAG: winged helix-turn-helix transcriptional regulator [Deltaproteobacteria bacterium]|nr:winged helix-turn-helix transcriptional regulator [Deltaproteobacteria bacterium]
MYQNGKLSVGVTPKEVQLEGLPLKLDGREFELLRLLIRHQGQMIHRRFLQQWIFGDEGDGLERQLIKNIRLLRKKLGDNPNAPAWIVPACASGCKMSVFN